MFHLPFYDAVTNGLDEVNELIMRTSFLRVPLVRKIGHITISVAGGKRPYDHW